MWGRVLSPEIDSALLHPADRHPQGDHPSHIPQTSGSPEIWGDIVHLSISLYTTVYNCTSQIITAQHSNNVRHMVTRIKCQLTNKPTETGWIHLRFKLLKYWYTTSVKSATKHSTPLSPLYTPVIYSILPQESQQQRTPPSLPLYTP